MTDVHLTVDLDGDFGSDSLLGIDRMLPEIVEALERRALHATFFVVGEIARSRAPLIRSLATAGHVVAAHGMTHTPFSRLTRDARSGEVRDAKQMLEDVLGAPCAGFRAPYFDAPPGLGRDLESCGYRWSSSTAPLSPVAGLRSRWRDEPHPLEGTTVVENPVTAWFGLPVPEGLSYRRLLWPASALPTPPPRVFYFHPYELLDDVPAFGLPRWMRPLVVSRRGAFARTHLWRWIDTWRAGGARFVTLGGAIC
jgi:hypothetical protein